MLQTLDSALLLLHVLVIGFNLTGWIWNSTRKWHLLLVVVTASSWIFGGFFYGFGYCFMTDWHWQVKEKLGVMGLPSSFIKYGVDSITGMSFDPALVDLVTGISFGVVAVLSLVVNRKSLPFLKYLVPFFSGWNFFG